MVIPAGALGFDALGDPAPPAQLAADGWKFRTFYIAQSSSMSTKLTDKTWRQGAARIQAHLAAGIGVLLNYESSAARPLQGGAVGRSDGAWSKAMCVQLGYPASLPILVSFDTEVRAGGKVRPDVIAYGREFAEACAPYPIGIYGGTPIMHELADINRLGWRAMASSWSSGSWPQAVVHWRQRRPNLVEQQRTPYVGTSAGWALDVNDAVLPFPAWSLQTSQPDVIDPPIVVTPQPVKEHPDMRLLDLGTPGVDTWWTRIYLSSDLVLTHADAKLNDVLGRVDVPAGAISEAELLSLLQSGRFRTRGPSPFFPGGQAPNAGLDAAWGAAAIREGHAPTSGGVITLPGITGTITFG